MQKSIPLTKSISVENGAHILYFYKTQSAYLENVVSFIEMGLNMGQHVIYIDSLQNYTALRELLEASRRASFLEQMTYVNNFKFYMMYRDFHFERVLQNLKDVVEPHLGAGRSIRLWGHVDWQAQEDIVERLHTYECSCDITVSDLGFLTVCAYDSGTVPSAVMIEMMRSHPLLMTDVDMVKSSLYASRRNSITLPSLSVQSELETERDLYKEKLDFVHVISHEVRNPLTVIKAYASLLKDATPADSAHVDKLSSIIDYCTVIDHEISDIIRTEHMLSSDALWAKKLIRPRELMQEVLEIMAAKARTQNVTLVSEIHLEEAATICANRSGFKLILSNLLSNAIKYSYEGGQVMIRAYQVDRSLTVEVIDDGCGMSAEQKGRLFQKYQKMNDKASGQGIGLFMVKKLVDAFSGTIEVESELECGSCFRVRFPAETD
ncbi:MULTISPECIES: MEDS domain-containing protein [Alicyclobacillus]|uniref:histidine kinase n=1 Tax=Alicyclobacillus acidoterrestris (strain ATCC 49025 / DSM 3922 / CIP 106132 / NCIMB 13137 / GD3B) TaxID=1356854 RepID=T0CDJ8_ALIAG|nr:MULTISPECIES: MEDS domain-containing protein [Alicyclobacillus]EPZ50919.1 hypothetical protein N007_20905 [Alicyclobacillus acidoterrestris ATCC 49025]UNO49164.1 MEDS domain-containing protein [Alicyclobacillus acidoterrestris]